jgi:hypothetical protein
VGRRRSSDIIARDVEKEEKKRTGKKMGGGRMVLSQWGKDEKDCTRNIISFEYVSRMDE